LASNEELQRDLGYVPASHEMQKPVNNMKQGG
jgi:hypothetical protein